MSTATFRFSPGEAVTLVALKLPGTVTGCMVDADGHQFRVVWWWDGTRRAEWLHEFEIEQAPRNGGVR